MQNVSLIIFTLIVGNLARNVIQLYCGNDKYIKAIKFKRVKEELKGEVEMWAECEAKQTPIRYSSSGEIKRTHSKKI